MKTTINNEEIANNWTLHQSDITELIQYRKA